MTDARWLLPLGVLVAASVGLLGCAPNAQNDIDAARTELSQSRALLGSMVGTVRRRMDELERAHTAKIRGEPVRLKREVEIQAKADFDAEAKRHDSLWDALGGEIQDARKALDTLAAREADKAATRQDQQLASLRGEIDSLGKGIDPRAQTLQRQATAAFDQGLANMRDEMFQTASKLGVRAKTLETQLAQLTKDLKNLSPETDQDQR